MNGGSPSSIPILDLGRGGTAACGKARIAAAIGAAARDHGFFYVVGHGVRRDLVCRLEAASRAFFALPAKRKLAIGMERGGRAWRGYFPVGGELTLGRPDRKEGLYFGAECDDDHPLVRAGTPLYGRNLFPAEIPELRGAVLAYMEALTQLGHILVEYLALSLGLDAGWFRHGWTRDPLILFRIFHYPPCPSAGGQQTWGVGEHTDYGLLTILWQDEAGGLQIRSRDEWIAAPPVPESFVCNLGDMLERATGGLYRSTPHRVRNESPHGRLSLAFFFDPAFDAEIAPLLPRVSPDGAGDRWDGVSPHEFTGTYGDYLLAKIAKVFPRLGGDLR